MINAAPSKPPLALIAGPTASGKSALALALAERDDGTIINADSAQVYRDLRILSARPDAAEEARAPHRLYGVREGAESYSAADWASDARREIEEAIARGRLPILVGGTGLYLRTLLEGIAPVPAIADDVRAEVRHLPVAAAFAALQHEDPGAAARLRPSDTARVARTLEVVRSTGRTLADWQKEKVGGIGEAIALRPLILLPDRQWLYDRCDRRFAQMMANGAVEEVAALVTRDLSAALPVMRAIGVPQIAAFLAGARTHDQALADGQAATRRYAKRQYTWFRHQPPPHWPRLTEPADCERIDDALALLDLGEE